MNQPITAPNGFDVTNGVLNQSSLRAFIRTLDASDPNNLSRVTAVNERMIALGITASGACRASLDFAGGGDSGDFGDPVFQGSDGQPIQVDMPNTFLVRVEREYCSKARNWLTNFELKALALDEAINQHVEMLVSATGCDWYNGDGGFGDWFMDVSSGETALSIDINLIESYTAHFETRHVGELEPHPESSPAAPSLTDRIA